MINLKLFFIFFFLFFLFFNFFNELKKDNEDLFHFYFRINHKNKNELMPSKLISKIQNYLLLFSLGDNYVNKSNLIINNFLNKILYSKGNTFF